MSKKKIKNKIWIFLGIIIILIMGGILMYEQQVQTLVGNSINPVYSSFFSQGSIPVTESYYTGNYKVMSKSGNESLYDVKITKDEKTGNSLICLEAGWDVKEVEDIKYDDKLGKDIISSYIYSVPNSISLYKSEKLIKEDNLIKTKTSLSITSITNPNKFCYEANPEKDFYLKFGDNSVVVIQETQVSTDSVLTNVTAEGNFTHLNISEIAPYDSLVGYWNFDGDKENTKLTKHYDWTKYNNDGTGVGDVVVNNTNCVYGDCARFDGNGDYVQIADVGDDAFLAKNWSLVFWFKADAIVAGQGILAHQGTLDDGTPNMFFQMQTNSYRGYNTGFYSSSNIGISTGVWYQVAYVWLGNTLDDGQWYHNGVFNQTIISNIDMATSRGTDLYLGNSYNDDFNGTIDEVMIFNTSLTSAQILAIYNNQSSRFLATGTQNIVNQNYMNISTGNNRVNVTTYIENNLGSSINLSVGYYAGSWSYTTPQVVSSGAVQTFTISSSSTNLTLNYTFYAGNSTNPFYSPIIKNNITYEVWNEAEIGNIIACGTLDQANTIYTLQNSIFSPSGESCFTIAENNITFDMNGYNITGEGFEQIGILIINYNYTTIKNGFIYYFEEGIKFQSSSNNILMNITSNNNTYQGIEFFTNSNNNTLIDITANLNGFSAGSPSIYFQTTSNNILTRIITNNNKGAGISLYESNNTLITDLNTNNNFTLIQNSFNNSCLNCSYSISNESVSLDSSLIRKWYYRAYVNDTLGNNVSNANITAYNVTGSYNFNLTTDSTGYTGLGQIIDYVNNGTRTYYSNYTIYAINSSYQTGSHTYNVTEKQSNYKDIFTLTLISVNCWTKTENVLFIPTGCVYQLNKGEKIEI